MKHAARVAGIAFTLVVMTGNLSFASPLTVAANLTQSGNLTLTAADTPAAGDNLTVVSGVTVASTGGDITLNVGDDLTLAPGSTLTASGNVTIILDAGNADAGLGSIATLAGQIIGQHVTITGGPDVDTLIFQGPAAIVTLTGAQSGTISAPGMTDIIFTNIENISGTVSFASVPEPGTWLLIASAGVAGLVWRVRGRLRHGHR